MNRSASFNPNADLVGPLSLGGNTSRKAKVGAVADAVEEVDVA